MATVTPTQTALGWNAAVITYSNMEGDDTGAAFEWPRHKDRSVQVVATAYDSATLVIQGSNDGDNWVTLFDESGTALSWTSSAQLEVVLQNTRYVRPKTSGGDGTTGTDLTVIFHAGAPVT